MAYTHGKFVWFEHVSHDVSGARRFYDTLFGWKSDGVPVGGSTYHMIMSGADGIGGYRQAMPGVPNHWVRAGRARHVYGSAGTARPT
jgi:hypothetical protein